MELTVLTANDIRQLLPMREAIDLMKNAFMQFSSGEVVVPLRSRIEVEENNGISLFMPSLLKDSGDLALKIVSVFPENARQNRPTIHAIVVTLDPETGQPTAILEGACLTAIRTGAASGAATDLLARQDASTVAIFGSGVQARTQLEAVCCVRTISAAWVYSIDPLGAETFCEEMAKLPGVPEHIQISPSPEQAIREADIICTATTASSPVFPAEKIKIGTHINAIGSFTPEMQELSGELMQRSLIVVDSRQAVLAESGDLIIPIQQGLLAEKDIHAELGEIVGGTRDGRTTNDQITVFKSVGLAVQDAITSSFAVERAQQLKAGVRVSL